MPWIKSRKMHRQLTLKKKGEAKEIWGVLLTSPALSVSWSFVSFDLF